jgi:hypothetical protein
MDIYSSSDPASTAEHVNGLQRRPAIVVIHGGGFIAGTRTNEFAVEEAQFYASHGYVAMSIDYRNDVRLPLSLSLSRSLALSLSRSFSLSLFLFRYDSGTCCTPAKGVAFLSEVGAVRDSVHDAKAAIRYAVRHAAELGIDPHRIAVEGASAGAIISASLPFVDEGSSGNAGFRSNASAAIAMSGTVWPFLLKAADESLQPSSVTP